jgi:predicted metal-dependent phosphoesterase TrpH
MPKLLLCELHAHTTWSDGVLTLSELVDLYGRSGFDVLAVTDHVVRDREPRCAHAKALRRADHPAYLTEIEVETERARSLYDLLLIPGLELTFDDPDPRLAAHAVAVGLREHVDLNAGLDAALARARAHGAALIGAHPYALGELGGTSRTTASYAEEPEWAAEAVDRFEVCNRHDFFAWVARARLPVVATGDFHRPEHLATWKTLLPAENGGGRRRLPAVEPAGLPRAVRADPGGRRPSRLNTGSPRAGPGARPCARSH